MPLIFEDKIHIHVFVIVFCVLQCQNSGNCITGTELEDAADVNEGFLRENSAASQLSQGTVKTVSSSAALLA